jgi:hypothetical protein
VTPQRAVALVDEIKAYEALSATAAEQLSAEGVQ